MALIAQRPILFDGRQYNSGDILPNTDTAMVEAWLKYGSAKRIGESEKEEPAIEKAEEKAEEKPEEKPEVAPVQLEEEAEAKPKRKRKAQ